MMNSEFFFYNRLNVHDCNISLVLHLGTCFPDISAFLPHVIDRLYPFRPEGNDEAQCTQLLLCLLEQLFEPITKYGLTILGNAPFWLYLFQHWATAKHNGPRQTQCVLWLQNCI
jgi:hypothetical protein